MSTRKIKNIGMLGGGQLGRMSALAGAPLGIITHVYCPERGCPASQVTPKFTIGDYADLEHLRSWSAKLDAITYEFENIPLETVRFLEGIGKAVYPSSCVLEIAQNRLREKKALNDFGLPTTRWMEAQSADDIATCMDMWGVESCIIKTTQFGYDGKGQTMVRGRDDVQRAWDALNADVVIVEEVVDFDHEISVIVARDLHGNTGSYTPSLNVHTNHILHTSTAPAPLDCDILAKAKAAAEDLAERLYLVGVLGVELFVTKTGEILVNEIAPRPHNSGHWTMDACFVSQFEQHMRAVAGYALGTFKQHHAAVMTNLLGDDINQIPELLNNPNAKVHDYGKLEAKTGRKMGHVNVLGDEL